MERHYSGIKQISESGSESKNLRILSGSGVMKINGDAIVNSVFRGSVDIAGTLTIGLNGDIVGSIRADEVIISGRVTGNLYVKNKITMNEGTSISGFVTANEAVICNGSSVSAIKDFKRKETKISSFPAGRKDFSGW